MDDFVELFRKMAIAGPQKLSQLNEESETVAMKIGHLATELEARTSEMIAAVEPVHTAFELVKDNAGASHSHLTDRLATLEARIESVKSTIAEGQQQVFAELEQTKERSDALRLKLETARSRMQSDYGAVESGITQFSQAMDTSRQEMRSGLDSANQALDSFQSQIDSTQSMLSDEIDSLGQAIEESKGDIENGVQDMLENFKSEQDGFRSQIIETLAQETLLNKKDEFLDDAQSKIEEELKHFIDEGVKVLTDVIDEAAKDFSNAIKESSETRKVISSTIDQLQEAEGPVRELIEGAESLAHKFQLSFPP